MIISKCVICGADLPVDMTQLLLDIKGNACCLRHEGTKELYKWIIKRQQDELSRYKQEAEKIPLVCAKTMGEYCDDNGDCPAICPKYRGEADK